MRISREVVLERMNECAPCQADEEAPLGARCACDWRELRLSIEAEVEREDGPDIRILGVVDMDASFTWSKQDIERLDESDRQTIEEEVWEGYREEYQAEVRRLAALRRQILEVGT